MSIKDIVDGIGMMFSALWWGIKDLFYQIYTSEYGMVVIFWVVVVVYVFIKFTDWLQRRRIAKEEKKLDEDIEKPEESEEVEEAVEEMTDREAAAEIIGMLEDDDQKEKNKEKAFGLFWSRYFKKGKE